MHQRNPRSDGAPALQPPTNYVPEDDNGNLTLLDHKLGVNSVARFEYGYDRNGMRTSMRDLDGLHEYGYDTLYQIVSATHPTVSNPLEQFQYDAAGNRLTDAYRSAYQYNELNQLVEDDSCVYEYDADGNMTVKVSKAAGDSTKYTWDIESRLVKVEKQNVVTEYVYGPLGRRLAKVVNGVRTEFRYDGEDLILTMNDAGAVTGSWTFGPGIGQPLAMNRGGAMHYYLADGLGSVRALADENGDVAQTYEYSVFGEIISQTGSVENPFTYTAREWEPEVGLYYYRARFYDAHAGRFLSEDPLGLDAGDLNLHRYVYNNTMNVVDPFGLYDQWDLGEDVLEFTAGLGNAVSFGAGTWIAEQLMDKNDASLVRQVKRCSGVFKAGEWASLAIGLGRMAYAGLAKGASVGYAAMGNTMSNARAAVAFRNGLKQAFRLNPWSKFRVYPFETMVAKYGTAEAIIAASGRTNAGINALGGALAAGGATTLATTPDCGCQ